MERKKYILKLRKDLVDKASKSVSDGDFDTFSSYVELAIQNQLEIGGDEDHLDAIDIDLEIKKRGSRKSDQGLDILKDASRTALDQSLPTKRYSFKIDNELDKIVDELKDMFVNRVLPTLNLGKDYAKIKVADPDFLLAWNFNRYFPIKVMLRVIIYLIHKQNSNLGGLQLDKFGAFLPDDFDTVSTIGVPFKVSDELVRRKRGEGFSTGFPIYDFEKPFTSKKAHKNRVSTNRFITIFALDYRNSINEVYGAMTRLGFIKAFKNRANREILIQLTEEGLRFSSIDNPVIDKNQYNARRSTPLGRDEIGFLIDHMHQAVPSEYEAMTGLLRLIDKGHNSQEKLKKEVLKDSDWVETVKKIKSKDLKGKKDPNGDKKDRRVWDFMNAIISRSTELGLLQKEKKALSVTYIVSQSGKNLI